MRRRTDVSPPSLRPLATCDIIPCKCAPLDLFVVGGGQPVADDLRRLHQAGEITVIREFDVATGQVHTEVQ